MSKQGREQGRRERAAAIQKQSARSERNRRMGIVGGVVVVLAIIIAGGFWYSQKGPSSDATVPSAGSVPAQAADVGVKLGGSGGSTAPTLVIGKKSAPVKVTVYEDFLCPYCREFEMSSRDFLHADAKKGLVQVAYRPFHLLPEHYSIDAMNAYVSVLQNSSPDTALKYHDLLYDNQPYEQSSSFPGASQLGDWAAKVGADKGSVESAVNSADPTYLNTADGLAKKAGVKGTPSVYVDGKLLTGSTVDGMANNLEKMIAAHKHAK